MVRKKGPGRNIFGWINFYKPGNPLRCRGWSWLFWSLPRGGWNLDWHNLIHLLYNRQFNKQFVFKARNPRCCSWSGLFRSPSASPWLCWTCTPYLWRRSSSWKLDGWLWPDLAKYFELFRQYWNFNLDLIVSEIYTAIKLPRYTTLSSLSVLAVLKR